MRLLIKQFKQFSVIAVDFQHQILNMVPYELKLQILSGKLTRILKPVCSLYPFNGNLFGVSFRGGFIYESFFFYKLKNQQAVQAIIKFVKNHKEIDEFIIETQYNNILSFRQENTFIDGLKSIYPNSRQIN